MSSKNKSFYSLVNAAVEQTTVAVKVTGVVDQFVKLCGITSSEVYSLMFWDNAIIRAALSDNVNAYCPTKKRIDSFKTFINYTFFRKLNPPKFHHKDSKINDKNMMKSISHKIRYCKLIFLLSQNQDNRHELLSQSSNNIEQDIDDEDNDISYQVDINGPLIFQRLFNILQEALDSFPSWIVDKNPYKLTCNPLLMEIDDDDDDDNNESKEMKEDNEFNDDKFIIKTFDLIKWCFCAIFMLSFSSQSRMEIVDHQNGIIIKHMIKFFVILKYCIDNNQDNANMIKCIDNIRSIFLLLKKLCRTVPFPQNIYGGHNGAVLLISEILIYNKSLCLKLKNDNNDIFTESEYKMLKETLLNVYFHGTSLLEHLNKACDLVKDHLLRYQRTNNQLSHICVNRRVCRNLCFGFKKYYLRFCVKCGNDLFKTFNEQYIEQDDLNIFIPDQVSNKEYMDYYFMALKKFVKDKEFKQFDNDNMFNIITSYLNYKINIGDYVDYMDELGNWCCWKVKAIDPRKQHQHRIKIGDPDKAKWDLWIDSRSQRIQHPFTFTKRRIRTIDDLM